ncbi:hypothetical protein pb186bvf_003930 [Paramecium bursaria]
MLFGYFLVTSMIFLELLRKSKQYEYKIDKYDNFRKNTKITQIIFLISDQSYKFMLENLRSFIVPSILTIGGVCITYAGFKKGRMLYNIRKLTQAEPDFKLIEKHWTGLSYNPYNLSPLKIIYILERSRLLNFEKQYEFTCFAKKIRQNKGFSDLKYFVSAIELEYDAKMEASKRQIKAFIEYKNHSFEQFWMINQQLQTNNQELNNANLLHEVNVFLQEILQTRCLKRKHYKLPTIDECLLFLREAVPLLKEKELLKQILKLADLQSMKILKLLFVFSYWIDLIQLKLQKQFEIYYYPQFNNQVPLKIRDEMKLLLDDFFQIIENQGQ